jgi:uncharacterized protein with GYD domain
MTEVPKYMIQASYNAEGTKGLIRDGGVTRREATKGLIESLGGTMESFYYALGEDDAFVIVEMPDHPSLVAAMLAIGSSGLVTGKSTALFSAEEMDEATKKTANYRGPGK